MKNIASVIGLGLVLAFGGSALAFGDRDGAMRHGGEHSGERGGERGHHMMQRMFSKLALSEQQEEAIKALRAAAHTSMEQLEEGSMTDSHEQMKALIHASSFDEAAYRELLESKQSHHLEMRLIKAKTKNGIWNLLSAEQQEKMSAMMEHGGKRGKRNGHRHQGSHAEQ